MNILLTDVDEFKVLVDASPGTILFAVWDDKEELTTIHFTLRDTWVKVRETPEEIWAMTLDGDINEEDDDDSEPAAVRDVSNTGGTVRVSGVPYEVPASAVRGCPSSRGDNDDD